MPGHAARRTVLLHEMPTYTQGDLAYGDVATPAAPAMTGADAIAVIDPNLDPIVGEFVDLNYVRDYMGNSPRVQANRHAALTFKTPFSGAGLPLGTKPAYAKLLRMCGMAETVEQNIYFYPQQTGSRDIGATVLPLNRVDNLIVGDEVSGTGIPAATTISSISTGNKTITLSAALTARRVKGSGLTVTRDLITYNTSAGASSGDTVLTFASTAGVKLGVAVSGTNIPANTYVLAKTATTVTLSKATTGTVSNGAAIQFDYSRVWYNTVTRYHEYGSFEAYMDRILHRMDGARGSFSLELSAGTAPMMDFRFLGLYTTPTDATASSVNYNDWRTPLAVNAANTALWFNGVNLNGKTATFDLGNDLKYRNLINAEDVQIVDRRPTGRLTWECDTIAAQDWFEFANAGAVAPMIYEHGTEGGDTLIVRAQSMAIYDLKYTVEDGIYFMDASLAFQPDSGNDEIIIEVR